MATVAEIEALIDTYVLNYAVDAFHDLRLNMILKLMLGITGGGSGGGGGAGNLQIIAVTSANFTNATDCPIVAANGNQMLIFYNEASKYIYQDNSEWTPLVGGGFTVTIPGFDSTTANFHFVVIIIS